MIGQKTLSKFLFWRVKHISNKNFIIILGAITGLIGGLAAVTLKSAVHWLRDSFEDFNIPLLYVVLPMAGILITAFLARKVLKEQLGHGVTTILYIISQKSSILIFG